MPDCYRLTRDEVQRYYERYIGPYVTYDGRVDLNIAQHAVDAAATELGVSRHPFIRCASPPYDPCREWRQCGS